MRNPLFPPYERIFKETTKLLAEEKNDLLLNEGGEVMAICVECKHFGNGDCFNEDLRYTDYVYGRRSANLLNFQGECKGFQTKPKAESIYESEKDENLAHGGGADPEIK